MVKTKFLPVSSSKVKLLPSQFQQRFNLNRRYLMSMANEHLLQDFYNEAGLLNIPSKPEKFHWGWESPTCQVRGHFLGHWLSGAARIFQNTGDTEIKSKADFIITELGRCQKENGGEWVFSIPEKYLEWIARGKTVWAPHYTIHKTLMGLYEMAVYAGNEQALEIMVNAAKWFNRWTAQFTRQQMDDILDFETGGMLETWANLYGVTKSQEHLDLVYRYDRPRLFDRLLAGEDALTNRHANTTIPEAYGAARAWEVTGDERWRRIAEAYWKFAVTNRGYFCTGGQTQGEIWTPPFEFSARLGDKTQEHCTVYNMMHLADYLMRWDGNVLYSDYCERNLYNGILAQQNIETGLITYFLPLHSGAAKKWGTQTEDFWCCHGSLVQAQASYARQIFYEDTEGLVISQFIPCELSWNWDNIPVTIKLTIDGQVKAIHRPNNIKIIIEVNSPRPVKFGLKIRVPWWTSSPPLVILNDVLQESPVKPSTFLEINHTWNRDNLYVSLPKNLTACSLPDAPEMVAFMDGPVVLAGLCEHEKTLIGDRSHPDTILIPDCERQWDEWLGGYKTRGQFENIRFIPLHQVKDEKYTVYFPIK